MSRDLANGMRLADALEYDFITKCTLFTSTQLSEQLDVETTTPDTFDNLGFTEKYIDYFNRYVLDYEHYAEAKSAMENLRWWFVKVARFLKKQSMSVQEFKDFLLKP